MQLAFHLSATEEQPQDRADHREEEGDKDPDEFAKAAVVRVVYDRDDGDDEDDQTGDERQHFRLAGAPMSVWAELSGFWPTSDELLVHQVISSSTHYSDC